MFCLLCSFVVPSGSLGCNEVSYRSSLVSHVSQSSVLGRYVENPCRTANPRVFVISQLDIGWTLHLISTTKRMIHRYKRHADRES
jgi:hypothetical protein